MGINDKGIALVFVLWVLVFLSVIVGSFGYATHQNRNKVFYDGLQTKAYYIAQAGFYQALTGYIQSKRDNKESPWRINAVTPAQNFGEGEFRVLISNESGKINLNKANAVLVKMLLKTTDLNDHDKDVIVDSILDWRDKDKFHLLNGAEDEYYAALPEPYNCRDDDFLTLTELLKVRGVTQELFENCLKERLSIKKNENELLPQKSSIQQYLQLENQREVNSIQTFLTLEKRREMNTIGRLYDHSKININAASPGMLMGLPGMTESLVKEIVAYRKEKDFAVLAEFEKIVGKEVYAGLKYFISLSLSRYYTITSIARVDGSDIVATVKMDIWIDNSKYDGYKVLQRY